MYGKVSADQALSDGVVAAPNLDPQGNLRAAIQGGTLQEAALAGRLFSVMNQTAVTTTADDALTWAGLGISNPTGTGKNAIIHAFGYAFTIIPDTDGALSLMVGSHAAGQTAALTILNSLPSGGSSVLYADDGATVTDHTLWMPITQYGVEGTNLSVICPVQWVDLKGSYILEPGYSMISGTTLATVSGLIMAFMWEEVDRA